MPYTERMRTIIIVGLGNPDGQYEHTRHNVGFMFLDYIAKKNGCDAFTVDKRLNALTTSCAIKKTRIQLVKPLTYVNQSGAVVGKVKASSRARAENIILVHDDLDIELGNAKQSFGKSSGGHKGVQSVIRALKTKDFYRLRIGTSTSALRKARTQSGKRRDRFVLDFVLSTFSKKEHELFRKALKEGYEKILPLVS